jgi:hypothetical protein
VDFAGVGKDAESLLGGGEAQRLVQADEAHPLSVLPAPDEGGGELQGAVGSQRVDGEDAQGAGAHLFGGLDLEGASPQVVDQPARPLEAGLGEAVPPLGRGQGFNAVEDRPPPEGQLRVAFEEGSDPLGKGALDGQGEEGGAVPEPQIASRSSQRPRMSSSA